MFRRIVVPLDGSTRARQAVSVAARIARASGGSVVLLSVLAPSIHVAWHKQLVPVLLEDRATERKRISDELARQAASEALQGVETVGEMAEGLPAQIILDRAEELQTDLIVLCSHGRTGITRWALGSVAQKVARHSMTPVLIVWEGGERVTKLPPERTRPVCVMVALDGSSLAEAAVLPAAHMSVALSAPFRGALHLVQVLPFSIEPLHAVALTRRGEQHSDLLPMEDTQAIAAATTYLRRVQQHIQQEEGERGKLQITSSVIVDPDVAGSLLAEAGNGQRVKAAERSQGCDVIAMATHGRGGLARWVMGSVTERVLSATRLPLLIVRPPHLKGAADGEKVLDSPPSGSNAPQ